MIEIIYRGEEEQQTEDTDIRLPKNVRQIGDCEFENRKIYVEDFVMSYVKHFSSRNLKYGVLLGNLKRSKGNTYLFITGAVCAKPVLDNEIVFDEDVWTGLYEDIKTYFDNVEIVGWFLSIPGMLTNDMPQIQKLHLDNFAGNDKVCFLLDRVECEDSFYMYGEGGMKKCEGHYIYYEKNADMQSYMMLNEEVNEIPKDYEQSRKKSINARVHRLLYKAEDSHTNAAPEKIEYEINTYEGTAQQSGQEKEGSEQVKRKLPTFAYSASSFMLIAILLGAIAFMNASGQLNELKSVVAGIGNSNDKADDSGKNGKNQGDDAKIVEAAGNIETTTANEGGETTVDSNAATTEESSTTISAEGNQQETQPATESAVQPVTEATVTEAVTQAATEPSTEQVTEPTVVPAAAEPRYYIVKNGDSLYSISLKEYGNVTMIDKIMQVNGITNENFIKEGDTILLP